MENLISRNRLSLRAQASLLAISLGITAALIGNAASHYLNSPSTVSVIDPTRPVATATQRIGPGVVQKICLDQESQWPDINGKCKSDLETSELNPARQPLPYPVKQFYGGLTRIPREYEVFLPAVQNGSAP